GKIDAMKKERYSSFDSGDGANYEKGLFTLEQLADLGRKASTPLISGKQELLNNLVNQYLFS
ncbi:MAG: xylose isomerase, partial [Sphaerochaetaceae bacterium]|nr:xylose isomerase [Sphaerochaetaceae bacterium]